MTVGNSIPILILGEEQQVQHGPTEAAEMEMLLPWQFLPGCHWESCDTCHGRGCMGCSNLGILLVRDVLMH